MKTHHLNQFADSMFSIESVPAETDAEVTRYTAHRALPLPAEKQWTPRRVFVPQGVDQQGRQVPTIPSAEPFPVVADRRPEAHDPEDAPKPSLSPAEAYLLTVIYVLSCCFAVWVLCVIADALRAAQ